ncbi:tRNA threonylcarbamoyladenosine dehydratase isoform X3 [Humulus lupulus]|uniref:tRNA threonylcarbamoyladenosine dehydratase isoform X3 n=1 Tax=Humulus lupulus TaxID=3486 RepID=UPI002B41176C|nr:tRNA threonylcarbamoyladenosine dehydratase isoform X3 [Humulus lupulus]
MGERSKSLALVGAGVLLGSASTLFFLRLISRKLAIQTSENAIELNCNWVPLANTKCHAVGEAPSYGMAGAESADILSDDIVSEHLTRNIQFLGLESQHKVTGSYVVVIGLGGVGSHAASMLLRSGVGRLLLVDFDQVSLSSLNRHALATRSDVGTPKAQCLKEHFLSIFPECHIEAKVMLYDSTSEDEILSSNPDFVLDCIDNIDTKVALLAACVRRGLKVLSAMGAGARADPTRIRVADLRESTNDPLSRAVRHRLKKNYRIEGGIPVVFSLEKPKAKLLPFKRPSGEEENPSDYQIVPGFRVRIIPVLGTIPAIFGQVMASYVVTQLAGLQIHTEPVVDVDEVMYVTKELWHGRSAREPLPKDVGRGMWRSVNELMLVRWDRGKPASVSNLVLLKFKEVDEHESKTLDYIKENEPEFFNRVSAVLKQAEVDFGLQLQ